MFDTIAGVPLHPLVIHATEVIVPAAALAVILAAVWPRFRRWAFAAPFGLALAGLVLVPVSEQSGEALEARVGESPLVETHAHMAEGLLPWVAALAVLAGLIFWWTWRERRLAPASFGGPGTSPRPRAVPPAARVLVAVLAVVAAVGTSVEAVRIGHSGAVAAWSDVDTSQPLPAGGGEGDEDGD